MSAPGLEAAIQAAIEGCEQQVDEFERDLVGVLLDRTEAWLCGELDPAAWTRAMADCFDRITADSARC